MALLADDAEWMRCLQDVFLKKPGNHIGALPKIQSDPMKTEKAARSCGARNKQLKQWSEGCVRRYSGRNTPGVTADQPFALPYQKLNGPNAENHAVSFSIHL